MDTLHISYCAFLKNANRKNCHYYCRVRERGKPPFDVDLKTKSKDIAEAWVSLRRSEVERYNEYVVCGEQVPADLSARIVRRKPEESQGNPTLAKVSPVAVRAALDSWEGYLRRIGKAERTTDLYIKLVSRTLDADTPLSDIDAKLLRNSLTKHDSLASATRKLYSVALREFTKFLSSEYGVSHNLVDCFAMVTVTSEEKGYWTPQQVRQIIEHVHWDDPVIEQNYKAYFWFLYLTGARQGEAGMLEWRDIVDGTVTFRAETTKNRKTRRVPLTAGMLDMLSKLPHDSKLVFSRIHDIQQMRYYVLKKAVKEAKAPMGSLHTFRRSASWYLYSQIDDIKLVSQLLGHSASVALTWYQKTREVDKVAEKVKKVWDKDLNMPTLVDAYIESGMF